MSFNELELDPQDEEFTSIDAFVEFLMDDERETFTHLELKCLNARLRRATRLIKLELESWGFQLVRRHKERAVRTFSTPSLDRWYGPGSSPTHGGSGWSQILGMAD